MQEMVAVMMIKKMIVAMKVKVMKVNTKEMMVMVTMKAKEKTQNSIGQWMIG